MAYLTTEKLTIIGAAGMIGSNMAQTALMMKLTPNICLYDPFAPALEGVAEELFHCGFEGAAITYTSDIKEALTDAKYIVSSGGAARKAGMTREEIAAHIKSELISQNLIKDPVVTVEFMNLTVSVLGEVANPGRYSIDKDYITLLEALSMAGDMTIFGKRDKVLVLREVEGQHRVYGVDLRSAEQLYNSPVYYLQQDDVVYVEPNSMRARQSTVNGNNVLSATFWMSLVSLITTVTVLFVK